MTKKKMRAIVHVPDPAGGMRRVEDRRFEPGDWPIRIDVPVDYADNWLQYLTVAVRARGWQQLGGMSQMEDRENSGSTSILANDPAGSRLDLVWERPRSGPLKIKARAAEGFPEDPRLVLDDADRRSRARETVRFYRRHDLHYEGFAWRGELWLSDTLRLGAPSVIDETATRGPRVVLVDA